jgi:hypothetical protein
VIILWSAGTTLLGWGFIIWLGTKPIYFINDKAWVLQLSCYNSQGTTQTLELYEKGKTFAEDPI